MLATLAMALVGLSAYVWRKRWPQGVGLDVHFPSLLRSDDRSAGCQNFVAIARRVGPARAVADRE
jgi:hypothetical protein